MEPLTWAEIIKQGGIFAVAVIFAILWWGERLERKEWQRIYYDHIQNANNKVVEALLTAAQTTRDATAFMALLKEVMTRVENLMAQPERWRR